MIANVTQLSAVAPIPGSAVSPVQPVDDPTRVDAFNSALQRQLATQEVQPAAPAPGASIDPDAQQRSREGLGIADGKAPAVNAGDMILEGMEKLRGVFDQSQSRVTALMNSSSVDTRTLMAMQMEVAQFSLMVDISSKLTGKSTQTFDTLMKGQ